MCFPSTAFLRCLNGILTLLKWHFYNVKMAFLQSHFIHHGFAALLVV